MDKDDSKEFKILNFSDPDKMQGHLESLKRSLPYLLQYSRIVAEYRKNQYDEYLIAGFTEDQALELCKYSLM